MSGKLEQAKSSALVPGVQSRGSKLEEELPKSHSDARQTHGLMKYLGSQHSCAVEPALDIVPELSALLALFLLLRISGRM